ncbi:MAG TPA: ATP-dependent helicase [Gordonia polyisoprenivorans]|uniref:DNA 3'-5' helicase n=1 Tax=Gordonia polyisoprenivorans TaxID=84595 RepID=A0A846WQS5_9ACTN|nr:ATP-dependent DNA helicase [Gordonia polyisoprenivorans]NKY03988.1 ATP-dependent helicase [Gordonia polyisoprenivorans]OZC31405.1 ATP-dependent DNA helicase [Gordonia polyisoprenivorans]GAB26184.1 putative ATP-dependent DNA helicase [Gordonia polyisoprenivorans NBRC 16320 = JCM 10675]HCS59542.1 ATP-dependent helicase [Gordonia polyisoprenivorans]
MTEDTTGSTTTEARPTRPRVSATSLAAALGLPPPTPEQVEVIEAPTEPMLVVAGAGAGKTETMASRVVWLVANGIVGPDEILGLTFTRKAASELGARIRRRLSMLAGSPALLSWDPDGALAARLRAGDPEVSTYHAYAGRLIADYGLLLPVEPHATLMSETELWQMAFGIVSSWTGQLSTTKVPASVTEAVLRLFGEMSEHLVDLDTLAAWGDDLYRMVDDLPKAPRQRGAPNAALRTVQQVIDERRELLPLVATLMRTMREQAVLDFGSQMSLAARLVAGNPEVVAAQRQSFRAVLLDEYQDTGHSQRVLLSALFGGQASAGSDPVAVTAVGDPIQSIYGWRGASAANLPRFATDFPRADGSPAHRRELLTSWRNPVQTLRLANEASEELRRRGVPVSVLRPRPGADAGTVTFALTETVLDERAWLADQVAARYHDVDGSGPPTVAVLVRRNEDSAPIAAELEARGIPAEVVGIGGLLHVPEITDVVATLRLMADPMAGTAAMRLLTGSRWQLGARDLAALWRRATELAAGQIATGGVVTTREELDEALDAVLPTEVVDRAGIADAVVDPGGPEAYSPDGYARIRAFGAQLESLRRRMGQPLPELVADVENTIGVAVEAQIRARRMRGAITGREHLDAFADYVTRYAERPGANLAGLLAFLDTAETIEKGLEPGRVEVAEQRVQILTVHAAKGLEWDVVAIPHLCQGIFPSSKGETTWMRSARELPGPLRGDLAEPEPRGPAAAKLAAARPAGADEGFPVLDLSRVGDRKELEDALTEHKEAIAERRLSEDRRLLYVAITRARHDLLVSAHHWSETGEKPRGGSPFFNELLAIVTETVENGSADEARGLTVDVLADDPPDGAANPLAERVDARMWPTDRLGARRDAVAAAADLVLDELRRREAPALFGALTDPEPDSQAPVAHDAPADEIEAWRAEVEVLLAEHERTNQAEVDVALPAHLSVSQLVDLDTDEREFARKLRRPTPFRPNPIARRGTAFHAWVERWFGATRLLDIDELPGAADESAAPDADLDALREAFLASPWAARSPSEVEVPFETVIGDTVIRGRIDAIFAEPDGSWVVVDWKTGAEPSADSSSVFIQLAAYRIAWAQLAGVPLEKVSAAFHYVRSGRTLAPRDLPDAAALAALLAR